MGVGGSHCDSKRPMIARADSGSAEYRDFAMRPSLKEPLEGIAGKATREAACSTPGATRRLAREDDST